MRRSFLPAALLAFVAFAAGAQVLDKPAATVRLIRSEVITVRQLQKQLAPLEAQAKRTLSKDERKLVLDGLIARSLLEQAAERDKVYASEAEIKARIEEYRKNAAQSLNLGRDLTDTELQQVVKNSGLSWEEFQKTIKYQILLVNYARVKRKSQIEAIKAPADDDAKDYYEANKKEFFADDMASLQHIFIDTRPLTIKEDREKALKRADDILRELKGGGSFEDLATKYSEDSSSKYKGGDIGTFSRADEQRQQLFGKDFFDAIFRLKKGETSGVLQSNIGYHIIRVRERIDAKLLTIDDKIPPLYQITVREFIKRSLAAQRQNDTLAKALGDIVDELKKTAEIKIFEENVGG
jgi:parvulin-like peptidyl-prolyl isomerase